MHFIGVFVLTIKSSRNCNIHFEKYKTHLVNKVARDFQKNFIQLQGENFGKKPQRNIHKINKNRNFF